MKKISEAEILYNTVIKNNYCIGCGICTTVEGSPFEIGWDKYAHKVAVLKSDLKKNDSIFLEICPFSGRSLNESELSDIFLEDCSSYNKNIGKYVNCYIGYSLDDNFRKIGTSGGLIKWLAYKLFINNDINYFIQVNQNEGNNDELFSYNVIKESSDIVKLKSKTAYYPVSLEKVIDFIENNEGKYAITGIPCFIKSLRLLSLRNEKIRHRIKFLFGIVCGSLKTANYSKCISWQQGIHPDDLFSIDFRESIENKPAYIQGNRINSKDKKTSIKTNKELFGTDYGMGFFKPKACDFCDDVFAEVSDISFGDAWLPEYYNSPLGTSIIIIRNKKLQTFFEKQVKENNIFLKKVDENEIVNSQTSSIRHRTEGLGYRIYKKKRKKKWYPTKRILANNDIDKQRKKIYSLRQIISKKSHIIFSKALKKNDIGIFYSKMEFETMKYKYLNHEYTFKRKTIENIKFLLKKLKLFVFFKNIYKRYKK